MACYSPTFAFFFARYSFILPFLSFPLAQSPLCFEIPGKYANESMFIMLMEGNLMQENCDDHNSLFFFFGAAQSRVRTPTIYDLQTLEILKIHEKKKMNKKVWPVN